MTTLNCNNIIWICIGCEDNPESLYELTEIDGILSWKKMFQELEYPRDKACFFKKVLGKIA